MCVIYIQCAAGGHDGISTDKSGWGWWWGWIGGDCVHVCTRARRMCRIGSSGKLGSGGYAVGGGGIALWIH